MMVMTSKFSVPAQVDMTSTTAAEAAASSSTAPARVVDTDRLARATALGAVITKKDSQESSCWKSSKIREIYESITK